MRVRSFSAANRATPDRAAADLEYRADRTGRDGLRRRHAEQRDTAAVGDKQAEEHVDGRGLTGAVGAEQRDRLAGCDGDVHAAHGVQHTLPGVE
jgi:hypothetical protein